MAANTRRVNRSGFKEQIRYFLKTLILGCDSVVNNN